MSSSQDQVSIAFDGQPVKSPNEWLRLMRETIQKNRAAGASVKLLERQEKQAIQFFSDAGLV